MIYDRSQQHNGQSIRCDICSTFHQLVYKKKDENTKSHRDNTGKTILWNYYRCDTCKVFVIIKIRKKYIEGTGNER